MRWRGWESVGGRLDGGGCMGRVVGRGAAKVKGHGGCMGHRGARRGRGGSKGKWERLKERWKGEGRRGMD